MFLLNIHRLVKGAKQAGLDPNYIEKLSNQTTYKPNDAVLKVKSRFFKNREFYRVFQLALTDFEDLGGQLKTTFRL